MNSSTNWINLEFLKSLAAAKNKKEIEQILNQAGTDELNLLRNICVNLCQQKINIPQKSYKKIATYKNLIRKLADPKCFKCAKKLKTTLILKGGFLPLLIQPALTALISVLGSHILHKIIPI